MNTQASLERAGKTSISADSTSAKVVKPTGKVRATSGKPPHIEPSTTFSSSVKSEAAASDVKPGKNYVTLKNALRN